MEEILAVAANYFSDMFTATTLGDTAGIFNNVRRHIPSDLNSALLAPFTGDEVYSAIRAMSPLKAPGLDGFPGNGRLNQQVDFRYPRVSDLIITESNTWDYALLLSLFGTAMADRIRCIPLSRTKPPDELVWRCDNTGNYTPKSGYKLLMEMTIDQHISDSWTRSSLFFYFFRALWGLSMPAKCKIFNWRLMHNYIPTYANLQQRTLQVRNTCPLCENAADTTSHFMFSCPSTMQILASVGLPPAPAIHNSEFRESFATWFLQGDSRCQPLTAVTYWAIWYARNKLVHEGSACSLTRSSTFIQAFICELDTLVALSKPSPVSHVVKWSPPAGNSIKINFDASFNSTARTSISGVIARDSQGFILAAGTFPHTGIAMLSLRKPMHSVTFSFVGRQGNEVAHMLAKLGIRHTEVRIWVEEAPSSV
ncbi:hypothetical protein V6N11_072287 [Hibiscus sabdariffa]|uniref:Reverse transcriptase zinc-binding domain-containing protein n=1 Tax=Hibiscus sabdariffa TaxID=183260 RepID=A0ABR2U2V9_9ROSI